MKGKLKKKLIIDMSSKDGDEEEVASAIASSDEDPARGTSTPGLGRSIALPSKKEYSTAILPNRDRS